MRDTILAVIALGTFVAFLGILIWEVPRPDLGAVAAVTLAFAIWDLLSPHPEG